ncbi:MAG: Rne/Rng family ribonuclease [Cyanobacteria bacterium]|nr:Rne/Rng family ribonuclease [Cyanobacteriota bacterium]
MTKRRVIVSERDNIAALMEDDRAVEFIIHRGDILLGDVYLASVENILPSIDAAFVNVGGDKMGFLHSSDVQGKGDLTHRLQPKQQLVVQVMKEPTGHKGPRVTTDISLPGRFLVLMPQSKGISISRKIEQQSERARLKSVVSLIKPPGVGVIIRTEANLQSESDIQEDFEILMERWQTVVQMADTSAPPTLLYRDQDLLYRVIREIVTDDVQEILVDTNFGQQRAQQLLQNWNMEKGIKVTVYNGNQSILVGTSVDREIKQALQTRVPLPSGGYLYIQATEALTVVDVNSGKFTSLKSQAETIRLTNLEATKEIARQLRLRNIGGMIIVDFIDMESRADQLSTLEAFENELAPDKSKPQIGQLSDLGLVEMTRHRQGQALSEIFTKNCTACNATGHAVEEFNWAPPSLDGDPRSASRAGRNAFPVRQVKQPKGAPPQRGPGGPERGPGGPERGPGRLALIHVDPLKQAMSDDQHLPKSLLFRHLSEVAKIAKGRPLDAKQIEDMLKNKLAAFAGFRFATVAKVAYTPAGVNGILSRINPKCNDIVTLVHAIEDGTAITLMPRLGASESEEEELDRAEALSDALSFPGAGEFEDDPSDDDDSEDEPQVLEGTVVRRGEESKPSRSTDGSKTIRSAQLEQDSDLIDLDDEDMDGADEDNLASDHYSDSDLDENGDEADGPRRGVAQSAAAAAASRERSGGRRNRRPGRSAKNNPSSLPNNAPPNSTSRSGGVPRASLSEDFQVEATRRPSASTALLDDLDPDIEAVLDDYGQASQESPKAKPETARKATATGNRAKVAPKPKAAKLFDTEEVLEIDDLEIEAYAPTSPEAEAEKSVLPKKMTPASAKKALLSEED